MSPSEEILTAIATERQRQFDLPGTESDVQKGPNDWITTIITLLVEGQTRHGIAPTTEDFREAMVKAAAVCVAALEHVDLMSSKNRIR